MTLHYSLKNKLNKELAEISTLLKVNKLSLNSAKSKFMIFRKPQKQIKLPIVKISGIQIECVDNFNFLWVIIDKNNSQNIRYNEQIKNSLFIKIFLLISTTL